jgi:hypothetical protein
MHKTSHVIPDFMFRMMRETPTTQLVEVDLRESLTNPAYKPRSKRKHPSVEYKFCTGCERLFQRYDDYMDAVVKNLTKRPRGVIAEASAYPTKDVLVIWQEEEAWRIPLFLLSVVFRASIASKTVPFYEDVRLSDEVLESIRTLVYNECWSNEIRYVDFVAIYAPHQGFDSDFTFAAPPSFSVNADGGYQGFVFIAGMLFIIGTPCGILEFSNVVPPPEERRFFIVPNADYIRQLPKDYLRYYARQSRGIHTNKNPDGTV